MVNSVALTNACDPTVTLLIWNFFRMDLPFSTISELTGVSRKSIEKLTHPILGKLATSWENSSQEFLVGGEGLFIELDFLTFGSGNTKNK